MLHLKRNVGEITSGDLRKSPQSRKSLISTIFILMDLSWTKGNKSSLTQRKLRLTPTLAQRSKKN
jgi:hypothetical protein